MLLPLFSRSYDALAMDAAPPPPRGRWRAHLADADVFAQPPHVLQRVARVVYLAAAAALLVWTVREQVDRFQVHGLLLGCVPLVVYAGSLGLSVTHFRRALPRNALFVPMLVLVLLHALVGLSGGLSLAADGSFSRAMEGLGRIPLMLCFFAVLGGPLLALMIGVTARRSTGFAGACVGILVWVLVTNFAFG